jgi:hypothetical protein
MVMGDALMFLNSYRAWMKVLQQKHNLKIGVLSVEYCTFSLVYLFVGVDCLCPVCVFL